MENDSTPFPSCRQGFFQEQRRMGKNGTVVGDGGGIPQPAKEVKELIEQKYRGGRSAGVLNEIRIPLTLYTAL